MEVAILLKLVALVEAGYRLSAIAAQARAKEAAGATPAEISAWIDSLYQKAFKDLNDTP